METNWIKISTSSQPHQAELTRGMLEENGIECIIVNKRDSAYLWGEVELYVLKEHVIMAKHLIDNPSR